MADFGIGADDGVAKSCSSTKTKAFLVIYQENKFCWISSATGHQPHYLSQRVPFEFAATRAQRDGHGEKALRRVGVKWIENVALPVGKVAIAPSARSARWQGPRVVIADGLNCMLAPSNAAKSR